ncbi:MAG: class I SAM-dependent methyltransferase [Bacteroidia bacterium]|nr:class I SAM-dependent methyltransferase [Bacteroidia bacterium]
MKSIKDKFSNQSSTYKKFRPGYPEQIYDELLSLVQLKDQAWDCGTGNGQVAIRLAMDFKKVQATDISQNQLAQAEQHENIIYGVERAEQTAFSDSQFDLITVAQAVHWFDFEAFNNEIKRVGKHGGIISIWGYGLLRIEADIDRLIDKFYYEIVGPYWNAERKHVDNAYRSIPFDFEEIPEKENKSIDTKWSLNQLEGYFNSWSSVQNFKKQNAGKNPVDQIIGELQDIWKENELKGVRFPIFMRTGRIEK